MLCLQIWRQLIHGRSTQGVHVDSEGRVARIEISMTPFSAFAEAQLGSAAGAVFVIVAWFVMRANAIVRDDPLNRYFCCARARCLRVERAVAV